MKERGHNIFVPGRFKNADKDKENIHYRRRDSHRRAHESCSINCSSPERGRGGEHQQIRSHDYEFRLRHRCFFGVFCYRNRAARVYGTTSDTVSDRSTKTVVAADDGQVGAAPSQHTADRGGEPAALRDRVELRHRRALRRHARREELPGTSRSQRYGGNARQFVGEVLSPGLYSRRTAGAVPSGNFSAVYYAQWPRLKSPREPFHNVNHLLVRSAGRITELIASLLVHKPARRCQLSRPWYARCVGGAAARVGRSFTYLWCCPALTERRRKRRAESAKLTMTVGVPSR